MIFVILNVRLPSSSRLEEMNINTASTRIRIRMGIIQQLNELELFSVVEVSLCAQEASGTSEPSR